jgi:hypothetical protein
MMLQTMREHPTIYQRPPKCLSILSFSLFSVSKCCHSLFPLSLRSTIYACSSSASNSNSKRLRDGFRGSCGVGERDRDVPWPAVRSPVRTRSRLRCSEGRLLIGSGRVVGGDVEGALGRCADRTCVVVSKGGIGVTRVNPGNHEEVDATVPVGDSGGATSPWITSSDVSVGAFLSSSSFSTCRFSLSIRLSSLSSASSPPPRRPGTLVLRAFRRVQPHCEGVPRTARKDDFEAAHLSAQSIISASCILIISSSDSLSGGVDGTHTCCFDCPFSIYANFSISACRHSSAAPLSASCQAQRVSNAFSR